MQPGTHVSSPLSISALTAQIKAVLEDGFFRVWAEGELSHLNVHRSGHVYLTLKDADARIDGVIWRSSVARLKYRPDPGTQVVVRGQLNVYPPQGSYKLIVDAIEPAGVGALQAALDALKKTLKAEGLFAPERKRLLPFLPRKVGVVTSATGAARRDIESVVFRRSPQIPILLYPAAVQGPNAAQEVAQGIKTLSQLTGVDVIIVGRGGGSAEDLWAFNEEIVARAIANCPIPVISAVGHETDTSISDLVADKRAATPSAAAELAVPVRSDLLHMISMLQDRMSRSMGHRSRRGQDALALLLARLKASLDHEPKRRRLNVAQQRLERCGHTLTVSQDHRLSELQARLDLQNPTGRLVRVRERLAALRARLTPAAFAAFKSADADLVQLAGRLRALSPLASLERGFSIVRRDETVVTSHDHLNPGDVISVLLHQGSFSATVDSTNPEHLLNSTQRRRT